MSNTFRYPGEFEPQTDVFVEWLPYGEPIKGFDALKPATEVVRNLIEYGGVQVHINCCPLVEGLEQNCKETLAAAGIDLDKIDFLS